MSLIEQALLSAINKQPQKPIIIAYSGGVDSQVLLHALAKLKNNQSITAAITVCHVNHGLSENALHWESFAQEQCRNLDLPLVIKQVNVQALAQQSLEALARNARYKALLTIYQKSALIITGHHSDDQSETFLLALKRGAGLKGLSAMAGESMLGQSHLLRPLLSISRQIIEQYALEHQLSWIEDESNIDTSFDRNFLRQDIMPLLTQRWPSIQSTINRSAQHCREGQLLLDELAEGDLSLCQVTRTSLTVSLLVELSVARFNNLIRYFLAQSGSLMPSTEQLIQVRKQLSADTDKTPEVKVADHYLRRFKGHLYLTSDLADISSWKTEFLFCKEPSEIDAGVDREDSAFITGYVNKVTLPDNLGEVFFNVNRVMNSSIEQNQACQTIVLPNAKQKVSVRFKHANPRCLPHYRQHSRPLKKVLQELGIPPWLRSRVPFIYFGETLVAVVGHFVCKEYLAKQGEQCLQVYLKS